MLQVRNYCLYFLKQYQRLPHDLSNGGIIEPPTATTLLKEMFFKSNRFIRAVLRHLNREFCLFIFSKFSNPDIYYLLPTYHCYLLFNI